MMRLGSLLLAALGGMSPTAHAQEPNVRWLPELPSPGAFVVIVVAPPAGASAAGTLDGLSGSLGGEPLHFEPSGRGVHRALGAIPIDASGSIPLTLALPGTADTTHRFVRVPVGEREFPTERLTVDPRFSAAPDSALRARIARERRRSRAVSRASHRTPRLWHGGFTAPVQSEITSPYGMGRLFNGELRSRHYGTDFDGELGDPVRAPNRGVVALVDDTYYGGRSVYLDHGRGLVTAYLHLSATLVAEGDTVRAGQVIGRIGATGRVTGPHLHWIARYGKVTVDGTTLLTLDLSGLAGRPE